MSRAIPQVLSATMRRNQQAVRQRYPELSMAFVPAATSPVAAGRHRSLGPRGGSASCCRRGCRWTASTARSRSPGTPAGEQVLLVIRAVAHARGPAGDVGSIVADLVVDDHTLDYLYDRTSVRGGSAWVVSGTARDSAATAAVITRRGRGVAVGTVPEQRHLPRRDGVGRPRPRRPPCRDRDVLQHRASCGAACRARSR